LHHRQVGFASLMLGGLSSLFLQIEAAQPRQAASREHTQPSKKNPEYDEHSFCTAVEAAFMRWETLKNLGLGAGPP
jgi:hypothetical protein